MIQHTVAPPAKGGLAREAGLRVHESPQGRLPAAKRTPGASPVTSLAELDPHQLECFIAVAEELNINRAATRLHMTQPPLTRRIKRLERAVGAELFRRTAGGLELTAPGALLLQRAYRIVRLAQHAVERTRLASAGEVGHLAVGYYDSAILEGIPALVGNFVDLHPGVTVSFELVPKHAQIDYLRDRLLHLGFGRHYTDEPGITCRQVATEELYVAARNAAAPLHREALTVADLRGRPLVVYPASRPGFADEVVDMCLRAGFSPTVAIEAEDLIAALAYVAIGAAIAVVPESAANTRPWNVTFVPLRGARAASLFCVYLDQARTPTTRLFTEFLDTQETLTFA